MKNDYDFWEKYIDNTINKIEYLLDNKKNIYADLHVHSDNSIDSNVTLKEIIKRSIEKGLDIISITDHDTLKVYDELYEYLKEDKCDDLIIIPGIEFTVDKKEYGSQFHIVQLMINPKGKEIQKDIEHQEKASWIRVEKQFKRLYENKSAQYFFKKKKILCTIEKYKIFLSDYHKPIPEYYTIMKYIQQEFNKHNIYNWELLKKYKENNEKDECIERKQLKRKAYKLLEEKYMGASDSEINSRFFHCILAVRGADDDFFLDFPSEGDLSVNSYGEIQLHEINNKNITIIAHPSEDKMNVVEKIITTNNNICGIEHNKRSKYSDNSIIDSYVNKYNMIKTIGSDIHDINSELYDDMNFYILEKKYIKSLLDMYKKNKKNN